ncbi:helix-turn-helix domain-containing protein [Streptococcus sp. S784/96/1]|uniref:helix-turn-helix domain-containing protein n=1 Tax=Streptococcus sp. S784/96/1 TaxID=2653499 RepID=UPI001389E01E|nr:helix-turn-helix domain-containing protein [Streptococcus sp. S784/96/1]
MKVTYPWEHVTISQLLQGGTYSHMSQDAQILYVLSGEVAITTLDYTMTFTMGEFFVVPNFSEFNLHFREVTSRVYLLNFSYFTSTDEEIMEIFKGDSKSQGEAITSTLSTSLQQLLRLYYLNYETASYWEVNALYFQIIHKLERKYLIRVPREKGTLTKNLVARFINQQLTQEVTIEDLAKQFYVSKQTMTRFLKANFGKSLGKYLQEKRFEQLEKRLSEINLPINTLVYDLGFKNLNSFNRLFKATYGLSPSQWRQQYTRTRTTSVSPSVIEEIKNFQELLNEKTSQLSASVKNDFPSSDYHRIWNIEHPELLSFDNLEQISKVIIGDYIRLPFNLEYLSERQYLNLLSYFKERNLKCYIVVSGNHSEILVQLLKKYHTIYGYIATQDLVIEVCADLTHDDWLADYLRYYGIFKNEIKVSRCGLGNFSMYCPLDNVATDLKKATELRKIDFLALDACPLIKQHSKYSLRENIVLSSHVNRVFTSLSTFISNLKEYINELPLYLTAFNLTAHFTDNINDHLYHAGYYLAFLDKMSPLVEAIGYRNLFDGDSIGLTLQEFSGGSGLITRSGLLKSTLQAEKFSQSLLPKVISKGENIILTADDFDNITILAYNYQPMGDYYSSDKDMDIYQNQNYIFNMQSQSIQIGINDLRNGKYKVTFHIMDYENGNGVDVLKKYTGLKIIDDNILHFIKQQYSPRIYQKEVTVTDQTLNEKIVLKPFEIVLISYEWINVV